MAHPEPGVGGSAIAVGGAASSHQSELVQPLRQGPFQLMGAFGCSELPPVVGWRESQAEESRCGQGQRLVSWDSPSRLCSVS